MERHRRSPPTPVIRAAVASVPAERHLRRIDELATHYATDGSESEGTNKEEELK